MTSPTDSRQAPLDDQTLQELVDDLAQRLHLHTPDTKAKAAALIASGVTMLGTALGEEGLDVAAACSIAAIQATAEQLGIDEVRQ